MEVQASVLQGAAFIAGLGAEFFGATDDGKPNKHKKCLYPYR